MPERDGSRAEVDLVGKVVPQVGNPVNVPLRDTTNEPSQVVVRVSVGISVDPSIFHLSEVRLAKGFC